MANHQQLSEPLASGSRVLQEFTEEEQALLRPKVSPVVGMEAVVKFYRNQRSKRNRKNAYVSWTLNKVALLDHAWVQQYKDKELPIENHDWWRVKIEQETYPGHPVGCFIVRPLWRVDREDLVTLAPSTWDEVQEGLTVIIYPRLKPWLNWIIPKTLRQHIMRKTNGASLVIPLSYPPEGQPMNRSVDPVPSYLLGPEIEDNLNELEE